MLDVVCAIIISEDQVLICQRSEKMKLPLKWEFPGGKIESNESETDGLKREIFEELKIEIEVHQKLSEVEHHYADFSIQLTPYICNIKNGNPCRMEHKQIKWVALKELKTYDWASADLPIVDELLEFWTENQL